MKTKKPILILLVAAFGAFLGTFNETFLNIALTPIMEDFNVGVSTVQWLTTAYMLGAAIMIPVASFLYRKFPTKPLYLFTVGLLIVGSLICALAPSFPVILAGRIVQSIGTGMLIPIGMNMVLSVVPKEKMGSYMGIMGAATTLGPSLSIITAGILLSFSTWHLLFFVFAFLMLVLFIMGATVIGKNEKLENPSLDVLSVILVSLALIGILYGISTLFSGNIIFALIAIVIGVICLTAFVLRQKKIEVPLVNFEPLKHKEFKVGIILNMIAMLIVLSMNVIMPLFIQSALGTSSFMASLTLFPAIVVSCILSPIAGKIYDKNGGGVIIPLGLFLIFVFILLLGVTVNINSLLLIALLYIPVIGSMSLIIGPSQSFALGFLSKELNPHGVTLITTGFQIAGCIGTSVFTGVYSLMTNIKAASGANLHDSMSFGFVITMAVAFVIALIGFIISLNIRKYEKVQPQKVDMTLETIMRKDVYTVNENDSLLTALTLIVKNHISGVPVVNNSGNLIGFISDGDIMRYLSKAHPLFVNVYSLALLDKENGIDEKIKYLMDLKVKDIAKKKVVTIDINTDLEEVCRILESKHLKKAPVMKDGKMIGVINRSNITDYAINSYLALVK